jgi:hypothetical protein
MDRQLIGEEDTFLWLSRGDLKGGTESEITTAQVQELPIKLLAIRILQIVTDGKRRRCKQLNKRVEHNIPA